MVRAAGKLNLSSAEALRGVCKFTAALPGTGRHHFSQAEPVQYLDKAFPIVGIGASAGGLESISELLAALPPKSDLAFVVVQHLDPQHESLLSDLLSKRTALPVVQIHDGLAVEAGHVYVIPPNTTLRLAENRFHLTARESGLPHPIDILFASLAEARAGAAIGVVLSGADSDGSLGVQTIKLHGGITFAQEPQSARFPSMPHSAGLPRADPYGACKACAGIDQPFRD